MTDPKDQPVRDEPDDDEDREAEISPLEGLMDPDDSTGSPAGDADAPAPPG
jgi:hypothetical protein